MAKVMVSVPDELLATVDQAAEDASQTRSAFVQEALRQRLANRSGTRRSAALSALRREFRGGSWVAEDLIRAERDR